MDKFPKTLLRIEGELHKQQKTIDSFCKAIGIHRATWQRWKSGKNSPTLRETHKIIAVARGHGIQLTPADVIEAA